MRLASFGFNRINVSRDTLAKALYRKKDAAKLSSKSVGKIIEIANREIGIDTQDASAVLRATWGLELSGHQAASTPAQAEAFAEVIRNSLNNIANPRVEEDRKNMLSRALKLVDLAQINDSSAELAGSAPALPGPEQPALNHAPPPQAAERAYDPAQHRLLFRVPAPVGDQESSIGSRLVGYTIAPAIADQYIGRLGLTGTGEITSADNISPAEYRELVDHIIPTLSMLPAPRENWRRTPSEALMGAWVAADREIADSRNCAGLQQLFKHAWLDGSNARQAVIETLALAKEAAPDEPEFCNAMDALSRSMEPDFLLLRRNDNFHGRLFETHLSEFLVRNPDAEMGKARDRVADFILRDFASLPEKEVEYVCAKLEFDFKSDPAAWYSELGELTDFLASPEPDNLRSLMAAKGSMSVTGVLCLAVKYLLVSPTLRALRKEATDFYADVIIPQRGAATPSLQQDHRSRLHGLLLPYQRGAHPFMATSAGAGIRPIDKHLGPNGETSITSHDMAALNAERPVGVGMSGSSNLLAYLFRAIAEEAGAFPLEAAQLASAAWLVHSGGHSFNEAYSVFEQQDPSDMRPLSYRDLASRTPTASKAVEHAFEEVVSIAARLQALRDFEGVVPDETQV